MNGQLVEGLPADGHEPVRIMDGNPPGSPDRNRLQPLGSHDRACSAAAQGPQLRDDAREGDLLLSCGPMQATRNALPNVSLIERCVLIVSSPQRTEASSRRAAPSSTTSIIGFGAAPRTMIMSTPAAFISGPKNPPQFESNQRPVAGLLVQT